MQARIEEKQQLRAQHVEIVKKNKDLQKKIQKSKDSLELEKEVQKNLTSSQAILKQE